LNFVLQALREKKGKGKKKREKKRKEDFPRRSADYGRDYRTLQCLPRGKKREKRRGKGE